MGACVAVDRPAVQRDYAPPLCDAEEFELRISQSKEHMQLVLETDIRQELEWFIVNCFQEVIAEPLNSLSEVAAKCRQLSEVYCELFGLSITPVLIEFFMSVNDVCARKPSTADLFAHILKRQKKLETHLSAQCGCSLPELRLLVKQTFLELDSFKEILACVLGVVKISNYGFSDVFNAIEVYMVLVQQLREPDFVARCLNCRLEAISTKYKVALPAIRSQPASLHPRDLAVPYTEQLQEAANILRQFVPNNFDLYPRQLAFSRSVFENIDWGVLGQLGAPVLLQLEHAEAVPTK